MGNQRRVTAGGNNKQENVSEAATVKFVFWRRRSDAALRPQGLVNRRGPGPEPAGGPRNELQS